MRVHVTGHGILDDTVTNAIFLPNHRVSFDAHYSYHQSHCDRNLSLF